MTAWLNVVGIGEDGLSGLGQWARIAVEDCDILFGAQRHLAMVPERAGQERIAWPSPFAAAFDLVLARRGQSVCILASGDPMMYGIGASLARRLDLAEMRVWPHPSAFSLAAARLGWPLQDCTLLTVHGRPLELVVPHLAPAARLLILAEDGTSPAKLAALLCQHGFGASRISVLERLDGPAERRLDGQALGWPAERCADLNVMAVECQADRSGAALPILAGLPDEAFAHDGQLTKRDIRAVTLARLAPLAGQLLWDVGAGCGSVAVEWMRSHPRCRAIAIEAKPHRLALIEENRLKLGVPGLTVLAGKAPIALAGLEAPDAVFIGGGLTVKGLVEACWSALKPGGRLVANAVTLQGEAVLAELYGRLGGEMTRISVAHAAALGGFDGWRTAMPVTMLAVVKP
ncbi:Precorrin-6Y C(5,15)-methyltransferase (decarboxylating) [Magnetospirillum sp. LM-5]|uniref:precorrin-6y C5,15-methyltransferase (decarboxylating) subunit CbiE n=1 Tax=Magnetospirillum sp. LM-5 TaxID=2681466 RepID=UPI001382DAD2|nr:precorrin-6y C5,15-methyltransferase (decarboxylating) subunit CbiE [Magnetospirillum sp. LM-5]CAA7615407.1 Precorrin-6Y C(5,15)-methyltransferase (decarboxylating) [Magnetospirillum sp. LM-5]